MELINITKEELNKMKVAPIKTSTKSYIFNGILYKMCFSSDWSFNGIDFLDKNRYSNKINYPINKLYAGSEDHYRYGYTQTYYDQRPNLVDIIDDKTFNFKTRLKLAENISLEVQKMHQHDFLYGDLHLEQILINNNDILFIDTDSVKPKIYYDDYNNRLRRELQYCAILIISFLYHYDLEMATYDYIKEIIEQLSLSRNFRQYLIESAVEHNISDVYMHQFLEELDAEKVNYDIEHVIKKRY